MKFLVGWGMVFVLMCLLGVWQLERYQYKKNLLTDAAARMTAAVVALDVQHDPAEFSHVKVAGYYLNNETILVQNKFHDDQLGYEVLTPFIIASVRQSAGAPRVLIDRGWLAAPSAHTQPTLKSITALQQLTGHVRHVSEYQFILGDNILNPDARPLVIQKIDFAALNAIFHSVFFPYVIKLDASVPNGFVRQWDVNSISAVSPARHLGYAMQWFTMAIVLCIACWTYYRKRIN